EGQECPPLTARLSSPKSNSTAGKNACPTMCSSSPGKKWAHPLQSRAVVFAFLLPSSGKYRRRGSNSQEIEVTPPLAWEAAMPRISELKIEIEKIIRNLLLRNRLFRRRAGHFSGSLLALQCFQR